MTNPQIEIGGELRPINFGRNAVVEFEKLIGAGVFSPRFRIDGYECYRALIYCGLKWGLYKRDGNEPKPKFTLLTVGDWMDEHDNLAEVMMQVMVAWKEAQPKVKNTTPNVSAPETKSAEGAA